MIWQSQDAKSKFSQLVNRALAGMPQIVTRHGKKVAVLVSYDEYERLTAQQSGLIHTLLTSPLRGSELVLPERDPADVGRLPIEL